MSAPIFEHSTSPLSSSNDGRLRIERDLTHRPVRLDVIDTAAIAESVLISTFRQEIADAYIAGYDAAQDLGDRQQLLERTADELGIDLTGWSHR